MTDTFQQPAAKPPAAIELTYDAFGQLVLTLPTGDLHAGETHTGVIPIRGFPFSAPGQWISFCDVAGREVYLLADIDQLPAATRDVLERDLRCREFIPVIERIYSVTGNTEPTEWHVKTDRGETRFALTSEDNIRRLEPHGAIVTDSHGIRFRIFDLRVLDSHSRKLLRRYL